MGERACFDGHWHAATSEDCHLDNGHRGERLSAIDQNQTSGNLNRAALFRTLVRASPADSRNFQMASSQTTRGGTTVFRSRGGLPRRECEQPAPQLSSELGDLPSKRQHGRHKTSCASADRCCHTGLLGPRAVCLWSSNQDTIWPCFCLILRMCAVGTHLVQGETWIRFKLSGWFASLQQW